MNQNNLPEELPSNRTKDSRGQTQEATNRETQTSERRGVVPAEQGTPREPGSVGAVPEFELTSTVGLTVGL